MSKRSEAIEVMKANEGKSMADVVKLIAERIGVTEGNAKSYYKWIVQHGMAPGEIVKTARAAKAKAEPKAKAPKAAKPKLVKVPKPRVAGDKEEAEKAKLGKEKTAEEIADIRAKNLARLKAVGQKYAKGQYAEGRVGGFTKKQAQDAIDYVQAVTDDIDSFKSPTFLSMDEVKVLV
ncbi:MAG: hypothetical protein ABFD50_21145 [Smithella sp.]|jgi:hypothetical protein